jgi:hypothetical protein
MARNEELNPYDLKTENHRLHEAIDELQKDGVPELAGTIIDLFEPVPLRDDFVAALRAVSSGAGLHASCRQARCRRSGSCQAEAIGGKGPPCLGYWGAAHRICFDAATAALTHSHIRARRRVDAVRATFDQRWADNLARTE